MNKQKFFFFNIFCNIVVSLLLIICIWDVYFFFIPVFLLFLVFLYLSISKGIFKYTSITIVLFILVIYQLVSLFFSVYTLNSILGLFELLTVVVSIVLLQYLSQTPKYVSYFITLISSISLCMCIYNIFIFIFKYFESILYGFSDFSQFRYLYKPMGILSNEWVTILFCFLPFPLLGFLMNAEQMKDCSFPCTTNKYLKYLFVCAILFIILNIFISFSRASYLSFVLWFLMINILIYKFGVLEKMKLLLYDIFIIVLVAFFTFLFIVPVESTINSTISHNRSTNSRIEQWSNSCEIIKDYPFFGVGLKNYPLVSAKLQDKKSDGNFSGRVNNSFIQLLLENGIFGFLIWITLITYLLYLIIITLYYAKNRLDIMSLLILLSSFVSILFRELFFSSLFYNYGFFLLFILPYILLVDKKYISKFNYIKTNMVILFFSFCLLIFYINITCYSYSYKKVIENIEKKDIPSEKFSLIQNSSLYHVCALKCEKSLDYHIDWNVLTTSDIYFPYYEDLYKAIDFYEIACKINPFDAIYYHNLSWLYFITNQKEKALLLVSKAIDYSYNTAVYHISRGMMLEAHNFTEAMKEYEIAIMLSPDICDSDFIMDFKLRNNALYIVLLNNVYSHLMQLQMLSYSSVIDAKIGKVLFSKGCNKESQSILLNVSNIHSNLSRPWYYLALIDFHNGNIDSMRKNLDKSVFLNSMDYLPFFAISYLFNEIGSNDNAKKYTVLATNKWNNKMTNHSIRNDRIYYFETFKNDIIPKQLFDYVSPKFRLQHIQN